MAGFFSKLMGKAGSKATVSEPAQPENPFDIDYGPGEDKDSVIYQVSGMLLGYPDEETLKVLPELVEITASTQDEAFIAAVDAVQQWLTSKDLEDVQSEYVQEYDLSRRHSLHLSYWTDGDTRRRGETLLRFKQMYRDSGMLTVLNGELPDYLPLVLEFCALVDRRKGRSALQAYRPSLELLRLSMKDGNLPHYGLLQSICDTLPGVSPQTQEEVQKMAGYGPPVETVGLNGYADHQLLQQASARSN